MARLTIFAKASGEVVASGINEFVFAALKGTTQKYTAGSLAATFSGTFSTVGLVIVGPADTIQLTMGQGATTGTTKITQQQDTNMNLPTTTLDTVYMLMDTAPTVPTAFTQMQMPSGTFLPDGTSDIEATVGQYVVAYKTTKPSSGAEPELDTVLVSMGYVHLTADMIK